MPPSEFDFVSLIYSFLLFSLSVSICKFLEFYSLPRGDWKLQWALLLAYSKDMLVLLEFRVYFRWFMIQNCFSLWDWLLDNLEFSWFFLKERENLEEPLFLIDEHLNCMSFLEKSSEKSGVVDNDNIVYFLSNNTRISDDYIFQID